MSTKSETETLLPVGSDALVVPLPCPFCGDRMQIDLAGTIGHTGNPQCIISMQAWHESKIGAWNTRHNAAMDLPGDPNGSKTNSDVAAG